MSTKTPFQALATRSVNDRGRLALVTDEGSWDDGALSDEIERVVGAFHTLGVTPGDRVALHMPNLSEAIAVYGACTRLGATAVSVNNRYKPKEVADLLRRVRPRLYLGEGRLYADVAQELETRLLPPERRYIVGGSGTPDGARSWQELPERDVDPIPEPDRTNQAPVALLVTSGTTGPSKLVAVTADILSRLGESAAARGVAEGKAVIVASPVVHASGLYYSMACLLTGATMLLFERFDAEKVLDAIESHRTATFFGLPFMAAALAKAQSKRPRDLSSLTTCNVAGDFCPPEIELAFERATGLPLLSFWAASEDLGAMGPGTIVGPFSTPLPRTEVRLVDDAGRDADAGEALISSPTTTPGYSQEDGTLLPLDEGWLETGDLMQREADGRLRFTGRSKELIVRGGSNVSPLEVETVLRAHPAIADAAVAGIPDAELGERVGAVLVLAEDEDERLASEAVDAAAERLADYKLPETVVTAASVPRNALAKIDRKAVVDLLTKRGSD